MSTVRIPIGEWIQKNRTRAGGYTRATLASIGVAWPPQHGWLEKLKEQGYVDQIHEVANKELDPLALLQGMQSRIKKLESDVDRLRAYIEAL